MHLECWPDVERVTSSSEEATKAQVFVLFYLGTTVNHHLDEAITS
jgi:hypothetical protein